MPRPQIIDYAPYYEKYIDLVKEEDLIQAFKNQHIESEDILNSITEEKALIAYEPGKWSIKELTQHLIDGERIFSYRALSVARGETNSLPPFDQDLYALNSHADEREWQDIKNEFMQLRNSTFQLFNSFKKDTLAIKGTLNNHAITPLSLGYIIIGHTAHHFKILKERYLILSSSKYVT